MLQRSVQPEDAEEDCQRWLPNNSKLQ